MPFRCPGCCETFGNDKSAFSEHLNACAPGILQAALASTEIALNIEESVGLDEPDVSIEIEQKEHWK